MATRLPGSRCTREELTALIEGRLSTASAKDELIKLATRLIVEEALEGEASDALGRDYYEHGADPGQGYRNGYRTGRLKTAEGLMEYSAPQIAGRDEPFRSAIREHLKGHTQGLDHRGAASCCGNKNPKPCCDVDQCGLEHAAQFIAPAPSRGTKPDNSCAT